MDLMSIFTGGPAKDAANAQRRFFEDTRLRGEADLDRTLQQNQATTQWGYNTARDDAQLGYRDATGALIGGRDQALGYLDQGLTGARNALSGARADLMGARDAYAPLSDLASRYRTGADMYSNALGLNGPQGNTTAVNAFQAGPGYNFNLDQGLEAISRRRNAAGMLDSGNADRDAQTFGMGLANQEYGGWLNRLQGYQPLELQATQGAAAGNATIGQNLANLGLAEAQLTNTSGLNKAGLMNTDALTLANLANARGTHLGGINIGEAGALTGGLERNTAQRLGLSQNNAGAYAKTYGDEAAAELAGSKNAIGLGLSLASLAAGGMGGMGSMGLSGGTLGMPGGSLGLSGIGDASMWNSSLPKTGFNWG